MRTIQYKGREIQFEPGVGCWLPALDWPHDDQFFKTLVEAKAAAALSASRWEPGAMFEPAAARPVATKRLRSLSPAQQARAFDQDQARVGTPQYRGIAPFWAARYRYLYNQPRSVWVKIHAALLAAGLSPWAVSARHDQVIRKLIKMR